MGDFRVILSESALAVHQLLQRAFSPSRRGQRLPHGLQSAGAAAQGQGLSRQVSARRADMFL